MEGVISWEQGKESTARRALRPATRGSQWGRCILGYSTTRDKKRWNHRDEHWLATAGLVGFA